MTSIENCRDELNNLQNQFYEENGKNMFFKNKQKTECAKMIQIQYRRFNTKYYLSNREYE